MRLRLRALDIKPIKIYVLFFVILHVFIVTPAVNAQFIGPDITKTNGSVVVNITIEETIKGQTYGPEAVVLKFDNWANTAGGETTISISPSKVAPPADRTVDTSPPVPSKNNESITISAELPDVIPAKYKACLVSIPVEMGSATI